MTAQELKNYWLSMPVDWFEPLTFGELAVGDKFIALPCPGDNDGHGGFKVAYSFATKTKMEVAEAEPGIRFAVPTGQATQYGSRIFYIPHSMLIIKIEE